jgi:hypothetical protein
MTEVLLPSISTVSGYGRRSADVAEHRQRRRTDVDKHEQQRRVERQRQHVKP